MKTHRIYSILCISSLFLMSCATYTPYAYDDLYYSPNNDPVKQVQKNPREDFNKTDNISYDGSYDNRYVEEQKPDNYPQSIYQNRYTEAEQAENNNTSPENATVIINNNNQDNVEYYDEDYAQTLQRINSPVRGFNTYDPYQRDRILYTQDPYFCSPTLYTNYVFWDPFVPRTGISVGWNSWSGWNVGLGIGLGAGYYNSFYSPWRPYSYWGRHGWMSAYSWGWGNPYWGYDPFFNPYWGNYGNPYWAGYNRGYYNGYYNGGGDYNTNSNKRYYNTPRGDKGSGTYQNNAVSTRPERPNNGNKTTSGKALNPTSNTPTETSSRPSRPERVSNTPTNSTPNRPTQEPAGQTTRETPLKYQTGNTPNNYSRPERTTRPSTPSNRSNNYNNSAPVQSRPSYSRPRQSNSYNQPNYSTPQQSRPQQTQPQRPSRPAINRSRPTYNRSTPSYTPSRSSGGGTRSTPSRPSRPNRR